MSLLKLPELRANMARGIQSHLSPQALAKWSPVKAESKDNTISILDVIGEDWWTGEGVTSKRIAGALRAIGERDVVVNINSPGGDMFEGIAIYEQLRQHNGHVTVNVLGMAASAASIIAMAGDTINIGRPSFLMIHNCWCLAAGNRHDFAQVAEQLVPFDAAMADVYHSRTGVGIDEVSAMMDKETWLNGAKAVEIGFADALLDAEIEQDEPTKAASVRRIEAALRASGLPRSEAQKLIHDFKSSLSDSADTSGLSDSAANQDAAISLQALIKSLTEK